MRLAITLSGREQANEGQAFSLSCDLMGDESLEVTNIRWDRLTPVSVAEMGIHTGHVLSFDTLSRDDEGQYRCTTTITSPYLINNLTKNAVENITVNRKCPAEIVS